MPLGPGDISFVSKRCNRDYCDNCDRRITPMIDCSLIKLVPADATYKEFSYQVKKAAEGEYITAMFGWDEGVQRRYHTKAWQQQRPDIITYGSKPVGTIATIENEDWVEIGQFFILPRYQRKGIGTYLLKGIVDKADRQGKNLTLKFLKNNPVKSLYVRNGFRVVDTDEILYYMERKASGSGPL